VCLVAFAINSSARWPLVIAANRDEFRERPTLPLSRWHSATGQEIIAGRDLRGGGTWLGISPGGRVAFLTNVREAQPSAATRSRGELVTRWLDSGADATNAGDFCNTLNGAAYGGFNLVLGDFQNNAWTWLSNRPGADSAVNMQPLLPGVYGLSNAALNTPWPKTFALRHELAEALSDQADARDADALQARLWTALANRNRAALAQLPSTGVPLAMEEALSSAFVDFPERGYGTRSSTVLLASALDDSDRAPRWEVTMHERTHLPDSLPTSANTPLLSSDQVIWQLDSQLRGAKRA
jgi:uncharacterized protein with NRDE domain